MKFITIGDLHGSPVWKTIQPADWDFMIFMGDYVDSSKFNDAEIHQNLLDVIDLKKAYPEKVILLWGNHDLAYFYGGHERHYASGFRKKSLPVCFDLFTANRKLFQAAFGIEKYLWTHAGVVQKWYDDYIKDQVQPSDPDLAFTFNRLFNTYYQPLFNVGQLRGGLYEEGGIFWADKHELEDDPLLGYHQIAGHNKTRSGIRVSNHIAANTSVTWVDCLDSSTEFYKIEIP